MNFTQAGVVVGEIAKAKGRSDEVETGIGTPP